jgi:polyhydroxybutyrate depolymerase
LQAPLQKLNYDMSMRAPAALIVLFLLGVAQCACAEAGRHYGLHEPKGWNHHKPVPLFVFFHGYGGSGANAAKNFGLDAASDLHGFVVVYPDGTPDSQGRLFFNATDACCDFENIGVNDVAYAQWLIEDIEAKLPIDHKRVYVAGVSNGGFMALRLACDLSSRITAAVSISGEAWKDSTRCSPTERVSILEIHGDSDRNVRPEGGIPAPASPPKKKPTREAPSDRETMSLWAAKNGCKGTLAATGRKLDFDASIVGVETVVLAVGDCPTGIDVELWAIAGGQHVPRLATGAMDALWGWLAAHRKH